MPERLEADTSLLNVSGGRPLPTDPPGLAAFAASRRTARGREKDTLFVCLGLRSRTYIPSERYTELLNLAASTFFGSPGSITSALRQALAAVNQNLLDANLRTSAPVQGGLICSALRGEDFYAVQCGPGIVMVAHRSGLERFPNLPSRPLGLSNALEALYFHTTVQEGEYFILSRQAPSGWSEFSLAGLGGLATLSNAAERLRDASGGDFAALVGRFEPGGTNIPLRAAPAISGRPSAARPSPTPAAPIKENSTPPPMVSPPTIEPSREAVRTPQLSEGVVPPGLPGGIERISPARPPAPEPTAAEPAPNTDWQSLLRRAERLGEAEPPAEPHIPVVEETASGAASSAAAGGLLRTPYPRRESTGGSISNLFGDQIRRSLRSFARALGITLTETSRGLRKLLARMLPEGVLQKEGLFTVPASVLMGIAIVIPLMVVGLAAMVYIERGRAEQFADTLNQAREAVVRGRIAPDPLAARPHWEAALTWLAQAEQLRPADSEVMTLTQEAQGRLDELDWVTRRDYQPLVVGGLGRTVKLKQIVLAGQAVYALDTSRNQVLRLVSTPISGYNPDPDFECASGAFGQFTIGELIDIGLLPGPNPLGSETIVALDTTGGLLYCAPGEKPLAAYLPSPETNWIRPTALEVYADRLYVLDPGGNEVWQFQASGVAFTQAPARYFTDATYDLQDVIEFSIAGGDLFLLRKDGRISNCTRLGLGEPATCTEVMQFSDLRPGRTPGDRLADVTRPVRLVYDPPPEPSLYLVDADTAGLYQLSLKLALVKQFRPRRPLPDSITALAIDASKRIFVAAGDNVYVSARP